MCTMQTPDQIRAAYDAVAQEYTERFSGELAHKPLDRELLHRFSSAVGAGGVVFDLGCGPGETTAFLHACGVSVQGLDLSPELVRQARQLYPALAFTAADMLALPLADESAAGIVAFYAIVHFSPAQLRRALEEMNRVLVPGGRLLLSFHVGEEVVHVEEFLGTAVSLDFVFFSPEPVALQLEGLGFEEIEVVERDPYPGVEYPSRRAYVFARKRGGDIQALPA